MSFWDNVKKFTQPYADDDYDEYEEDEVDGYEEEETTSRFSRRSVAESDNEMTSFDFDVESEKPAPVAAPTTGFNAQVVNISSGKQQVVLFRPSSFNDTSKAADDLRNRRAVIVNMENVDKAMARRVVDFLSGCVYALDGDVKKIAQSAYLFCPHNMDIVGDLEALQAEVETYM
jgi:cell division inhibitor SepF